MGNLKPWIPIAAIASVLIVASSAVSNVVGPVDQCTRQCHPLAPDVNGHAPKTGDEVTTSILYPHFQDILNRAPMNMQLPSPVIDPDLNQGFAAPTVNTETGTIFDVHFETNWISAFVSPGLVEIDENGNVRVHQEPGLAADVELAGDTMNLYVYLSAHAVPGGNSDTFPGDTLDVGVMPQVAVYARLETGRHAFQGTLIAEGDTGAGDAAGLIGGPGRATLVSLPGQPDVYEILVPLGIQSSTIPSIWSGSQGALLSINVYQVKAKDGFGAGSGATQADWRWRTGVDTPPHLVFQQTHPLRSADLELVATPGGADLVWSVTSPWGSYDPDIATLEAVIRDASGSALQTLPPDLVQMSVDHDGHFRPVVATWHLDASDIHGQEDHIDLSVLNLQQTYRLEATLDL